MTSIAQIQAQHKVLVADFNSNNEVGVMVEFTDPTESTTIELKTIAPAYTGTTMQGGTGYVSAVTEGGETRELPIVFVVALTPVEQAVTTNDAMADLNEEFSLEPEPTTEAEQAVADDNKARAIVALSEKPTLKSIGMVTASSLKKTPAKKAVTKTATKAPVKSEMATEAKKPAKAAKPKKVEKPKESIGDERTNRRIAQIQIKNIMGIEELEFDLDGKATLVTGKNGEGKSSIIRALTSTVAGGYSAELVRMGEDSGEVVLVMDDEMSVRKKFNTTKAGSTTLRVDGKTLPRPQAHLNALFDSVATDPAKFLASKPASQLEQLLEATPMALSESHVTTLNSAMLASNSETPIDFALHPIRVLDASLTTVNGNRRNLGTQISTNEAATERLKAALPENMEPKELTDLEGSLATLREHLTGLSAKSTEETDNVRLHQKRLITAEEEKVNQDNSELIGRQNELNQQLLDINNELNNIEVNLNSSGIELKRSIEDIDARANNKATEIRNQLATDMNNSQNEISATEMAIRNHSQYSKTLEHIAEAEAETTDLKQQRTLSEQYIEKLNEIKSSLLTNIPIDGLEVNNGSIVCEGIPFKMLNTAKQAALAIRIAVMRLDTNPEAIRLVIIDGIECMDTNTLSALLDAAEDYKVQLIMAKTTDGPLEIQEARVA